MLDALLIPPLACAGLADPETVFRPDVPTSCATEVTDKRDGRVTTPLPDAVEDFLCGIRDGGISSVLSSDIFDPCRDGGFEPCLLKGRELGFEPARDPEGVMTLRVPVLVTFRGV